jgi:hypothetical protein
VQRLRLPAKMGRAKLMRWTARLMEAQDLADAVETMYRMARASPPTLPVPGRAYKPNLGWRVQLRRTARGLATGRPHLKVISDAGNDKLPFYTWSTLPLFTCPGAGECADWCYSLTAWRVASPWARQAQNTLLLRFDRGHIERSFAAIPPDRVLRLYVDGDFDSSDTFDFWMRLLLTRPDVSAYSYSKSWDVIWEWWQTVGKTWPRFPRYWLNLSSGGRPQKVSREEMLSLPFCRGEFLSLPVKYSQTAGWARYDDRAYHQAVREAGGRIGLKVFSCPGDCGSCCGGEHACGSGKFQGVVIANGIH